MSAHRDMDLTQYEYTLEDYSPTARSVKVIVKINSATKKSFVCLSRVLRIANLEMQYPRQAAIKYSPVTGTAKQEKEQNDA